MTVSENGIVLATRRPRVSLRGTQVSITFFLFWGNFAGICGSSCLVDFFFLPIVSPKTVSTNYYILLAAV